MTQYKRGLLQYSLPLAGLIVVAGCAPKDNAPGVSAAPKSGETVALRLAFFPNVTHAVALVGTGKGFYSASLGSGVNIQEQTFNAGPAEIEALFGDQVDIGYVGPGPAVNGFAKSKGKALRIIAGAASGGASLVVRADSGIIDLKGLAGKRVSSPQTGGTQDISLRHALQTVGLTSTDKGGNVAVLPAANPDTLTLFVKKELDAAWVPEPWVARLVKEGNGKILIDERDLWPGKHFATTVVIVRKRFLDEHPDLVAKFLEAHVQSVKWIRQNPADARKLVGDRIKTLTKKSLPDDVLTASMSRTDFTFDPLRETVLTFADWSKSLGFQKEDRNTLKDLFELKPLNDALAARKLPAVQ
jgi:NitT/TauT family transport system substrate-binding protein